MYLKSHKENVYYHLISEFELTTIIDTPSQKTIEHYIGTHPLSVWTAYTKNNSTYEASTQAKYEMAHKHVIEFLTDKF